VENGAHTVAFRLNAFKQVEERAGDKLNGTLVVTAAVADLLKRGMSFFHAKKGPTTFNLTQFGLNKANEQRAAYKELCRLKRYLES